MHCWPGVQTTFLMRHSFPAGLGYSERDIGNQEKRRNKGSTGLFEDVSFWFVGSRLHAPGSFSGNVMNRTTKHQIGFLYPIILYSGPRTIAR